MRRMTLILKAVLGTAVAAGIAAALFCAGIYAQGSRDGTRDAWTSADDRKGRRQAC